MPWDQLTEMIKENRRTRENELEHPPVACPIDGAILLIHPETKERRCPLGNYTFTGAGPR